MGSVVRDIDGNGTPDWFVTSIGPVDGDPAPPIQLGGFGSSGNRAYLNSGDGTFSDATDQLGLRNGGWGWGAAIEDFGNDGRLSVVMTNGYSIGEDESPPPSTTPCFWVSDGRTPSWTPPWRSVSATPASDGHSCRSTWIATATWTCWSTNFGGRAAAVPQRDARDVTG